MKNTKNKQTLLIILTYLVVALFLSFYIIPQIITKKTSGIEPVGQGQSSYQQHEIKTIDGYGRK